MKSIKVSRRSHSPRSERAGTATVELALVLPVFIMLLFGTLEIGLMARSSMALSQVGREAARAASVGAAPTRLHSLIGEVSTGLNSDRLTIALECRSLDEQTGAWGNWTTLSGDGAQNSALSGDQVRIVLTYRHLLATGSLLADVLGASEDNVVTLSSTVVSVRE